MVEAHQGGRNQGNTTAAVRTPASKIRSLAAPIGREREGKEGGGRGLPRDGVGEAIGALNREQSRKKKSGRNGRRRG